MSLLDVIQLFLLVLATLTLIPALILLFEVVAAILPPRKEVDTPSAPAAFAVLVPAHNEALTIADTLASIVAQLTPADRVLVVADNCTDATASVAHAAGAEVIERQDAERRGKGYALAYGLHHLAANPPQIVIIIDADCQAAPNSLAMLAAESAASGRPLQAHYELVVPKEGSSPYLAIASFAWRVKNHLRPLGLKRLGLPCQLMGSGMAFPWPMISDAKLASSDIVEDLSLGLELARKGHAPHFFPAARITSAFPLNAEGQATQRARWETGHLNTIAKRLPVQLLMAILKRNAPLLALTLDAAVPPIAFLAFAIAGTTAVTMLGSLITGTTTALALALMAGSIFTAAIALAWARVGTDIIPVSDFRLAYRYALDKLGLYRQIVSGRQIGWVRSKRDQK
jgi:cellulose synthase/poly-beta-1,6-N-acetylglucosamine synthase-like glycosyltransferase